MIMDMIGWYKSLNDKKIIFIYSGPLWSEGICEIAGTLNKCLEFDEIPKHTSQEVFSVFIEQMNNMLMYSADMTQFNADGIKKAKYPKGTFILGKEGKTYFIQTGNVMKNESVELAKSRIDYLNTLGKEEIRKYYKEQMKQKDNNPESKGSGLGFIEIARRTTSKIVYSFVPYRKGLTFFTMYVTINGENNDESI